MRRSYKWLFEIFFDQKEIVKNKLEYKISVVSKKELILIVGRKHLRKLLYCGGAVNIAKKINEKLDEKIALS